MCLEFGSCFGGRTDDYGGERLNHREEHGGGRRARGHDRRGNHGTGTDGHKPAYHHQPPTAVDEARHKAYHDGSWKANHAGAGARGGYATYAQHKADTEMPKLPTWHNKVGDDAYAACLREAADTDRRNNAAMDYHQYPTSTAFSTTTLGRY
ncbi:hypothetical protein CFC21_039463 [Triticum aestivum]|uniref:Uncharacterized protein n=2 Tax=Triticum aestivum TaxID=4565 RepID=A0A3B6FJN1_WHEAT|nr:hypothetical protein CFC21_039463 [Triticum aestivum]